MASEPVAESQPTSNSPVGAWRAVISLATYNERENLPLLINEILGTVPQVNVLVVDDNSPDGTGALADEFAKNDPRVHALHRSGKLGLGTAILAGMNWA